MKDYLLNYYPYFKCVAGECEHTCCAGWQIQIDEESLNAYTNNNSDFCEKLKSGINLKKACFKVDKKGRCAFLNQYGLCEIINNLGEQSLCQVCRDHPRFRSFYNDRTETGLGFCCAEATKIILSFKDKIAPVLIKDDGKIEELDFNQKNLLDFREKAIRIIQDRKIEINQRISNLLLLCRAKIEPKDLKKILRKFLSFERLNKSWTARLKQLKRSQLSVQTDQSLSLCAEQFLANSLYRHLYDAEDTLAVRARTVACVLGWWLINGVYELEQCGGEDGFNLIVDVVRAYSAEVEYSQKNLSKLFLLADKFIKI